MKSQVQKPAIFPFVLVIGAISISFASIFIRLCGEVPSLVIASFRTGVVSLFLLPFFLIKRESYPSRLLLLSFLSGLGLALHFGFWISSLKYTTVASSLFVLSVYPFLVALGSHFILKERLTVTFTAGSLLTLAGIGLIFSLDLHSLRFTIGNLLSLLGAISLVIYYIPGRIVRKKITIIPFLFVVYTSATFFLLLLVITKGYSFTGYSPRSYLYLLLLALVSQGLGHSSFNWALKYIKAGLVSITTLAEPIGASILAWIIFKESLSAGKIAGAVLVVLGIIVAWRRERA